MLKALALCARRGARRHCVLALAIAGVLVVGDALAAEQASSSGIWSWFRSSAPAKKETVNPFDQRPPVPLEQDAPNVVQTAAYTPGLAQPKFLAPSDEPAPPSAPHTASNTPGLTQPKFIQPQDEVVVTDAATRPASQSWPTSNATASLQQPRVLLPPGELPDRKPTEEEVQLANKKWPKYRPTAAPSWFGLVQGLAGTNTATYTAPPEQEKSALEAHGAELAKQVAGIGTPQPGVGAPPIALGGGSIAESLLPVWTEPQHGVPYPTTAAAAIAMPTGEPAVAVPDPTIMVPVPSDHPTASLWAQMGFVPESQVAQASSTSTPRPSVPQESVFSALWRPIAMDRNAPEAPRPTSTAVADSGEKKSKSKARPESETVPDLLQPFYATNGEPGRKSSGARGKTASPTEIRPLESSLARQLMLGTDEYLQAAASPSEAPASSDPSQTVANVIDQWSSLSNPFLLTNQPLASPESSSIAGNRTASGDAMQASFLQEPLPGPNSDAANSDDIRLPGEDDDDGGSGDGDRPSLIDANQLGEAPEDNTLEFLRTQTVLLKPGKMQFDIGFEYQLAENDFPIVFIDGSGDVVGVDEVQFRGRELAVPLALRYGVTKRIQAFLGVPVGWSNTQVSIDGVDIFDNDGGLGDISFGATAQLCDANKDRPYTIGTISAIAPTGGDPFTGIIGFSPTAPALGNGFWALGGNLLWIETRYDPVIVFYGLGTRFQFSHRYRGIEWQPGPEYNYTFGYGFAVNERVTLSTQFFGAYVEELKANGDRLEGTNQEPMNVQLAATFIDRCDRIVEPFVTFGLTDDAVSSNVGITWTY